MKSGVGVEKVAIALIEVRRTGAGVGECNGDFATASPGAHRYLLDWRILGRQSREGRAAAMKILLAEDSKFLSLATERALTTAGYEVISAGDGDQALRLAREHVPALILLDVMLPKMSGPDVLKALKQDPATAAIPVMMLTSLSQKNAKQFEKDGAS